MISTVAFLLHVVEVKWEDVEHIYAQFVVVNQMVLTIAINTAAMYMEQYFLLNKNSRDFLFCTKHYLPAVPPLANSLFSSPLRFFPKSP